MQTSPHHPQTDPQPQSDPHLKTDPHPQKDPHPQTDPHSQTDPKHRPEGSGETIAPSSDRLRVMIVDDEALIRNLIRMRVDWASLGMEIVAEASGAGEALALLETVQPDILFTDICMPAIDGIALSRMVMERNPAIRIVVVTGHDEFEYAKSCIKIGVSDFLLKPLRAEELTQTAIMVRDRILKDRKQDRTLDQLQRERKHLQPALLDKALTCLVTGCGNQAEALAQLEEADAFPSASAGAFQVAVVELEPAAPTEDDTAFLHQRNTKAFEILRRAFRNDPGVHVLPDGPHRLCIVSGNREADLDDCGDMMLTQLLNGCHCHVLVGTGTKRKVPDELSESYRDACRALSAKFILGRNRVIRHEEAQSLMTAEDDDRTGWLDKFSLCLRAGMSVKARALMDEGFSTLMPGDGKGLATLRRVALDIVLACGQAGRSRQSDGDVGMEGDSRHIDKVLEIANLPDMKVFLGTVIDEVAALYAEKPKSASDRLVERVLAHIQSHLGDASLTLSGTAADFYVSPSHLSRLFRRETGRSFVEYVTRERMKLAFEYVTQSDMKSFEIGKRVGIDDPHYFSILFKKHAGMSVNECRKR